MVLHYNWPFEGKHTAQVAWDEIDFHTLDLDYQETLMELKVIMYLPFKKDTETDLHKTKGILKS